VGGKAGGDSKNPWHQGGPLRKNGVGRGGGGGGGGVGGGGGGGGGGEAEALITLSPGGELGLGSKVGLRR